MTHPLTPREAIEDLEKQCAWLLEEGGDVTAGEGRLFPDHCKVIRLAIRVARAVGSWKWNTGYGARDKVMAGLAEEWRAAQNSDDLNYVVADVGGVVIDAVSGEPMRVTGITHEAVPSLDYYPPATIEEFVDYLWKRHDTIIGQALAESDLEPVYREKVKARIEEIRNTVGILEHMQRA